MHKKLKKRKNARHFYKYALTHWTKQDFVDAARYSAKIKDLFDVE
jgi:hypothetical protein